jgi:hypothetical protein
MTTTLKPGDFVICVRMQVTWEANPNSLFPSQRESQSDWTLARVYIAHPYASSNDDKRRAEMGGIRWCQANEFSEKDHGLTWCLDDPEEIAALKVVLGLS